MQTGFFYFHCTTPKRECPVFLKGQVGYIAEPQRFTSYKIMPVIPSFFLYLMLN